MLGPLETALIGILLLVLMFGMGTTLTADRFRDVLRHPKAFLIGTASQFVFMPIAAYSLARLLALPDEVAVGLVIMGSCPGGTTSNLFAHLARADVALSVSMTAASKAVGVVMMPLSLYLFARPFTSTELGIPYGEIVKTLVVLLVPVALGMGLRRRFGERFANVAERVGSISGIAVLVLLVGVMVARNGNMLALVAPASYAAAIGLGVLGLAFGDGVSRLAGLPVDKRRAVSFETGVQNSPLAFAIIVTTFPAEAQDSMMRLPLVYALFILIEASILTVLLRRADLRAEAQAEGAIEPAPL